MFSSKILSSLNGLSAAVTGGSSGLGFATVSRLSKLGCIVAIIDVNEPKELPNNCYFIKADVSNEDDVREIVEAIENTANKLDILVNCAGFILYEATFNIKNKTPHSLDEFERVLKVNTTGTFNMIRLCCLLFQKNEPNENNQRGIIINSASVYSYDGSKDTVAYSASKAAIAGMTLPLARDLAELGIRVMAIAPGPFFTPLIQNISEDVINTTVASIPFPKRLGQPDEFAHLVQAIIENPMLNGEVIRLDGALRISS